MDKAEPLISSFQLDRTEKERIRVVPYSFVKPPPANPLIATEDDEATWKLCHWVAENVIPTLKRYLAVSL